MKNIYQLKTKDKLITGYFGIKTKQALSKFQEKYKDDILTPNNLTTGTGYFGASTIKKMEKLYGGAVAQTSTPATQTQRITQLKAQIKQLRLMMIKLLNQLMEVIQRRLEQKQTAF